MFKMNVLRFILANLICLIIIYLLSPVKLKAQEKAYTFDDALEIAKKNSPDIQQARMSLDRSQKLLEAQRASLKSQFSLNIEPFGYYHNREFNPFFNQWNTTELKNSSLRFTIAQPILFTDGTIALRNQASWQDAYSEFQGEGTTETFSNNLFIAYDQPIFTFNRLELALNEVELDNENALLNYRLRVLLLERLVAQSFYTAYEDKMRLIIAQEDYENRDRSYQIIKNKVDAGLVAREELLQAELDMTSSKSQMQNQKVALDNTLDELKDLIGISLFDDITVVADITMDSVSANLEQALQHGLANRFELRERDIDIEVARNNLIRSTAVNEFRADFSLSYGIIGTNNKLPGIYDNPTQNQQLSLSFEIPLWDWGERNARINASQVTIDKSKLSYAQEKNSIIIAIRQAYRSLQNQFIQVELQRQNVKTAQLTYEINLERYRNGDLTSMDLNLVQNQLSQSQLDLLNAMIGYKMALIDLKIESLWDFERNKPVIILDEKKEMED
jgi:outer membrane protein TolC